MPPTIPLHHYLASCNQQRRNEVQCYYSMLSYARREPAWNTLISSKTPTTSFLTATTLIYAIGAGITAAAGTRLALQLILGKGFKLFSFQLQDMKPHIGISCHYLPVSGLDVVAVSQAPSPESNPNSPLPVNATVGQYPTCLISTTLPQKSGLDACISSRITMDIQHMTTGRINQVT
eukprot:gene616-674_t